jgi:hypothetical protein
VGGILVGLIGAAVGGALTYSSIGRSSISTAALGLIFELPVVAFQWGVQGALIGFCTGYLLSAWRADQGGRRRSMLITSLLLLVVGGRLAVEAGTGLVIGAEVRRVGSMAEPQLGGVLDSRLFGHNRYVLAAVAGNERASTETLRRIAIRPEPDLQWKLGSIYDVMGSNRHGLAVMRLVTRNPHVDAETLELLSHRSDPYLLGDVAMNPKLPEDVLARLLTREERMVSWGVALNPRTPTWALSRLSTSSDEYIRSNVARNRSTPPDDLRRLAHDSQWNVRRDVATNPSTPVDELEILRTDPDERVRGVLQNYRGPFLAPLKPSGIELRSQGGTAGRR